ncbi:MAG TPA: hypothetical protein DCW31_10340 [Lactobacillus sp.]|nr:hypothetical protein [Lactobacillus sp.]
MRKRKDKYWLVDSDKFDAALVKAGVKNKHDLAEKAKLDYSILTHIYSRPLTPRSMTKICLVLNVSADDLFKPATTAKK